MRKASLVTLAVLAMALVPTSVQADPGDAPACKDHPILTRVKGYVITRCDAKEYESRRFLISQSAEQAVEGRYLWYRYEPKQGTEPAGQIKILRNYESALKAIGATVVYSGQEALVVRLTHQGQEVWIDIRPFGGTYYDVFSIQKTEMAQEVVADAALLGKGIAATGHVAVYGIYFDTGKADIKPESETTLVELAKLLKQESTLKVHVVGHTDNQGAVPMNMTLSQKRAEAVVKALVARGIEASRLNSHGAGPFMPVASNRGEEGRKLNRRVELVEQ